MDNNAVLMRLAQKDVAYYGIAQRMDEEDTWIYFWQGKAITYDTLLEETRLWYATETYRQLAQGMRI